MIELIIIFLSSSSILRALVYLVARHEADLCFSKFTLMSLPVGLLTWCSVIQFGALGLVFALIGFTSFALWYFCYVPSVKALSCAILYSMSFMVIHGVTHEVSERYDERAHLLFQEKEFGSEFASKQSLSVLPSLAGQ